MDTFSNYIDINNNLNLKANNIEYIKFFNLLDNLVPENSAYSDILRKINYSTIKTIEVNLLYKDKILFLEAIDCEISDTSINIGNDLNINFPVANIVKKNNKITFFQMSLGYIILMERYI